MDCGLSEEDALVRYPGERKVTRERTHLCVTGRVKLGCYIKNTSFVHEVGFGRLSDMSSTAPDGNLTGRRANGDVVASFRIVAWRSIPNEHPHDQDWNTARHTPIFISLVLVLLVLCLSGNGVHALVAGNIPRGCTRIYLRIIPYFLGRRGAP